MNVQRKQKGFTIIEVVLVLAIAGLIFLMVFIALPALQRSQRDAQRKDDLSRFVTAVQNYSTDNRSTLPNLGTGSTFIAQYLTPATGDTFDDPSGAAYTLAQGVTVGQQLTADKYSYNVAPGVIYYTPDAVCGTDADTTATGTVRNEAFQIALESGGFSCQNI